MIVDRNVETIVSKISNKYSYPTYVRKLLAIRFRERVEHGYAKYGVTTERTDLSLKDWVQHAIDEMMDTLVYLQVLSNNSEMYYALVNNEVRMREIFDTTLENLLSLATFQLQGQTNEQ